MIRYHSSSSSSRKSWIESAPALLTSTSRRPSPRTASSTARRQSGGLATSPTAVRGSAPMPATSAATSAMREASWSNSVTRAALLGEAVRGGPPDAAGSPADQRGHPFEPSHVQSPSTSEA